MFCQVKNWSCQVRQCYGATTLEHRLVESTTLTRYIEVADALRDKIRSGRWKPGDPLPRTSDLATQHGTSRATITHALAELGRDGLITYRSARTGWHVSHPPPRRRVSRTRLAASERAEGRGFFLTDAAHVGASPQVDTTVSTVSADPDVAGRLDLAVGDQVVQRHRVMRLDSQPAQIATGSIPAAIAAGTPIEYAHPGDGGIVDRLAELGYPITTHIERVRPERTATAVESAEFDLLADRVCEVVRVSYSDTRPVLTELIALPPHAVELIYEIPAE